MLASRTQVGELLSLVIDRFDVIVDLETKQGLASLDLAPALAAVAALPVNGAAMIRQRLQARIVPLPRRFLIRIRSNARLLEAGQSGSDKEVNWLPASQGRFSLYIRAYWGKERCVAVVPAKVGNGWKLAKLRPLRETPDFGPIFEVLAGLYRGPCNLQLYVGARSCLRGKPRWTVRRVGR